MARRESGSARRSSRLSSTAAWSAVGGASAGSSSRERAKRSPRATHRAKPSAARPAASAKLPNTQLKIGGALSGSEDGSVNPVASPPRPAKSPPSSSAQRHRYASAMTLTTDMITPSRRIHAGTGGGSSSGSASRLRLALANARRSRSTRNTQAARPKRVTMTAVTAPGSRMTPLTAGPPDTGAVIRTTAASAITKAAARLDQASSGITSETMPRPGSLRKRDGRDAWEAASLSTQPGIFGEHADRPRALPLRLRLPRQLAGQRGLVGAEVRPRHERFRLAGDRLHVAGRKQQEPTRRQRAHPPQHARSAHVHSATTPSRREASIRPVRGTDKHERRRRGARYRVNESGPPPCGAARRGTPPGSADRARSEERRVGK